MADYKPTGNPPGRPSEYNEEAVAELLAAISSGKTLLKACEPDHMPGVTTIYKWFLRHPEFEKAYARARLEQADVWADECVDISNTPVYGEKTVDGPTGTFTTTEDAIAHRKLQIDTRKWMIAKLRPDRYGDKLKLEHTGADGAPIETVNKNISLKDAAELYSNVMTGKE